MIVAVNSTCCCFFPWSKNSKRSRCFGIEADAETEGEAEAEASAGRVHGGNNCRPLSDFKDKLGQLSLPLFLQLEVETEAAAGRVHSENNCSSLSDSAPFLAVGNDFRLALCEHPHFPEPRQVEFKARIVAVHVEAHGQKLRGPEKSLQ